MFCTKCGKETEGKAEFCTQCGVQRTSASPSKSKKSHKTRNIVIGVVTGVVAVVLAPILIAVIVLAASRFSGEGGTSGLPQNLEIGQAAQTSEQKATVLSADRDVQGDYTLITVDAQVENIGDGSLYAMASDFSLSDSEGNRYDTNVYLYVAGDSFEMMKELYQGEKTSGNLRFVVPASATGLELAYDFGTLGDPLLAKWQLD